MPIILAATLGNFQLIPEVVGFTNPDLVDLYKHHPESDAILKSRELAGIQSVDEIWLITTNSKHAEQNIEQLLSWYKLLRQDRAPSLKIWKVFGTDDLSDARECSLMSECILRMVLHATRKAGPEHTVLSLAGGRKTMSSDLGRAAAIFGCRALLHVTQNESIKGFREKYNSPETFLNPILEEFRNAVTPIVVCGYPRNPVLDIENNGEEIFDTALYPLPLPDPLMHMELKISDDRPRLTDTLDAHIRTSSFLYCHYTSRMITDEKLANFMAMYSLPPEKVKLLREIHVGFDPGSSEIEVAFLRRLPKTDLHCHFGGIASPSEIIEIAAANRKNIERYRDRLNPWLDMWKKKIASATAAELYDEISYKDIRKAVPDIPEPICMAAFILLFEDCPEYLTALIYGPYQEENRFQAVGFITYERLGDVQGSGLLQSKESIIAACRIIHRQAVANNIRYLELRCSPVNYTRGGLTEMAIVKLIDAELSSQSDFRYSLIFIASRHGRIEQITSHIRLANEIIQSGAGGIQSLRGFDLAGEENSAEPIKMRDLFLPMMENCMHLTIHAGETAPVNSIWQAVYHLNAERIGHGLTLKDNPVLMEKFIDRGIALEMCPSSNAQIVGFQDNYLPETKKYPIYPLKQYLEAGLRVTVNTDNPGISKTNPTHELLQAGRLSPNGLSLWDIILLIRNGYKAGFAPKPQRQEYLRKAEKEIIALLEEGLFLKTP